VSAEGGHAGFAAEVVQVSERTILGTPCHLIQKRRRVERAHHFFEPTAQYLEAHLDGGGWDQKMMFQASGT